MRDLLSFNSKDRVKNYYTKPEEFIFKVLIIMGFMAVQVFRI